MIDTTIRLTVNGGEHERAVEGRTLVHPLRDEPGSHTDASAVGSAAETMDGARGDG